MTKNTILSSDKSSNRKEALQEELSRCISLLKESRPPEKVILFGTLAQGRIHEWSDIDLVVVRETRLPFWERIRQVRKLLQPRIGMDIMVYTPEEFAQLCSERRFFREEIIEKGQVVYER